MNTFNEYQTFTQSKAVYNTDITAGIEADYNNPYGEVSLPFLYPVLALAEEAGEVAGKVAKFVRKYGEDTKALGEVVLPELGDVLYQLSETARQFGFTLQDVVDNNVAKLTDRQERGVLIGEGDNR